jgi:hypothetical protein
MRGSARCCAQACRPGCSAAVFAHRLLQVGLEGAEPVAFGRLEVSTFGQEVNQRLDLLYLRCCIEPD